MASSFLSGRVTLFSGDCMEVLDVLPEGGFDAVCTDPPYHLTSIVKRFGKPGSAPAQFGTDGAFARASRGFMSALWDGGDIAFRPELWAKVWRVMKPGAYLVAFNAPKHVHRMACAIEDAGFEIRDRIVDLIAADAPVRRFLESLSEEQVNGFFRCLDDSSFSGELFWAFGSGFPKSHNLKEEWQGWGTALKPAYEPIVLARKPLIGTIAQNVLAHGTGAINIDACRVDAADNPAKWATPRGGIWSTDSAATAELLTSDRGRWPANVIHDGSDEVVEAFPATETHAKTKADYPTDQSKSGFSPFCRDSGRMYESEAGSAARFFYSAKADSDDRIGSKHPTVKPLDLMQYLVRLVTPPKGVVLDPFAGTGTTGEAAWREGLSAVLIEREAEYIADIERRMSLALAGPDERARESTKARLKDKPVDHGPLFQGEAA